MISTFARVSCFIAIFLQTFRNSRCDDSPMTNVSEHENYTGVYTRDRITGKTRIHFHSYSNLRLKEAFFKFLYVESVLDCALSCGRESTCFSFNLGRNRGEYGKYRCELLQTDMYNSSEFLRVNKDFNHYSILVSY